MKYAWIIPLVALPIAACTIDNPAYDAEGDGKADEAGTSDTDTGKLEAGDAGVETGDGDTSTTTTGDGDTSTTTTGDGDTSTTTTGDGDTTTGTTDTTTTGDTTTDTGGGESGNVDTTDEGVPLDTSTDTGEPLVICSELGQDACDLEEQCQPAWVDTFIINPLEQTFCYDGADFTCINVNMCLPGGTYLCNPQYPNLMHFIEGDCAPMLPLGWEPCGEPQGENLGPCP